METTSNKIFTILVGDGVEVGDNFTVVGRTSSLKEARLLCRQSDFIRKHVALRKDGAYVLIVSSSGHNVFIPIQSLLVRSDSNARLTKDVALAVGGDVCGGGGKPGSHPVDKKLEKSSL